MLMPTKLLLSFILIFLTCPLLHAEVRLPALFCDHMMIQCDVPVRVWGWADPAENVTVTFNGQKKSVVAGKDGFWTLILDPTPAGGPHGMTVAGKNGQVVIKDILAGEVWIGSGQSNMFWPVKQSKDAEKEIAAADWPEIRLFTVEQAVSDEPKTDCKGTWQVCSPKSVPEFSATAYYFGRELHKRLKVPVGVIHSSWRGTSAECWISRPALQALPPIYDTAVKEWGDYVTKYPERKAESEQAKIKYDQWRIEAKQADAKGLQRPPRPKYPYPWKDPVTEAPAPHRLYNAMIAPLIPYTIRGVIWSQGRANYPWAIRYRELFPALIADWRKNWGQGESPFIFAQQGWSDDTPSQAPVNHSQASDLRESQLVTAKTVPHTAMVVTYDLGEFKQPHYANKQEKGRRLALCALAKAYGQKDVVYSGPAYQSMAVEGGKIRLRFDHVGSGLVLKEKRSDAKSGSFAVAGKNHKFVWAEASVEKDTVVVQSPEVPDPVAVRYLWNEYASCVLYNKEDLPAPPFRTDDWPTGNR